MAEEKIIVFKTVELSKLTPIIRKSEVEGRPFYERLKKSLKKEGLKNPLLVENRPTGLKVTVGCTRLFALRDIGRKRAKAVIVTYPQDIGRVEIPTGKRITVEDFPKYFPSLKRVVENPGYLSVKLEHIHLKE